MLAGDSHCVCTGTSKRACVLAWRLNSPARRAYWPRPFFKIHFVFFSYIFIPDFFPDKKKKRERKFILETPPTTYGIRIPVVYFAALELNPQYCFA